MNTLQVIYLSIGITFSLIAILVFLINFTRNFFTRSRYVRIETFNLDKSISVRYRKKTSFSKQPEIMLNPDNIFTLKGYTTIIFTEETVENINPLDFESSYPADKFRSAIESKVIHETFSTLKSSGLDMLKIAVIMSGLTMLLVAYLLIREMGLM